MSNHNQHKKYRMIFINLSIKATILLAVHQTFHLSSFENRSNSKNGKSLWRISFASVTMYLRVNRFVATVHRFFQAKFCLQNTTQIRSEFDNRLKYHRQVEFLPRLMFYFHVKKVLKIPISHSVFHLKE